jgi:hypothetical protein
MKDIDYDAYLKTIPDLATSQKDIIKKYLEEQCEKDEALKALYKPSHIDGCYNFILECVRKTATGGCNAVVEDAIVFKMARDYFIEILPKLDEGLSTLDEIIPKAEVERYRKLLKKLQGRLKKMLQKSRQKRSLKYRTLKKHLQNQNNKAKKSSMMKQDRVCFFHFRECSDESTYRLE